MRVCYIAAELGPKGIRVHAISPGPLVTREFRHSEFDELLDKAKPKRRAQPGQHRQRGVRHGFSRP